MKDLAIVVLGRIRIVHYDACTLCNEGEPRRIYGVGHRAQPTDIASLDSINSYLNVHSPERERVSRMSWGYQMIIDLSKSTGRCLVI